MRDAIPRSDPDSIAAAAAIGHDRSFQSVTDLAGISVPALIILSIDARHPTALAEDLARILPNGYLASLALSSEIRTIDDFAHTLAPNIRDFLKKLASQDNCL